MAKDFLESFTLIQDNPDPDHHGSGCVSGSAILAFTDSVGEAAKEDIKNATLFASLASSSRFSVLDDPEDWYKQYFEIIQALGFTLQAADFSNYIMHSESMQIDKIILEILSGLLTEGETLVIQEAISFIKSANGGKPAKLFSKNSTSAENGGFQVYPCTQSPSGDVTLKTGFFYYKIKKEKRHILFVDLSKEDITMRSSKAVIVFDQKVYSMGRDTVLKKLGIKQHAEIASFKL